jgi:hypothetical protein
MSKYRWWLDPGRMAMIVLFFWILFPLENLRVRVKKWRKK